MALTKTDYAKLGLDPKHCGDMDALMEQELLQDPELKREYDKILLQERVAKAITETRKAKGLKQKELAQRAGTSQTVISRIENGNVSVGIKMLQRIADALGTQVEIHFR